MGQDELQRREESAAQPSPAGETLSDVAYERILQGLMSRRVPAGAFVSQSELVELVGIPIAPLRDALRMLEAEGVLVIHPRSGIQFIKPDLELTRSTYQFRLIVERYAVRVFAERADKAALQTIIARHQALIDVLRLSELTSEGLAELEAVENLLHNAIIGSLNNPLIESSYRRLRHYLGLLRLNSSFSAPVALRTLAEHMAILEACQRRDADAAEAALQAHFAAALQRVMGML